MMELPRLDTEEKCNGAIEFAGLIRKGATMHPQAFESFYRDGKTCALGAALFASCKAKRSDVSEVVNIRDHRLFKHLIDRHVLDFLYDVEDTYWQRKRAMLRYRIEELNDDRRLSRERIADIIERWARLSLARLTPNN